MSTPIGTTPTAKITAASGRSIPNESAATRVATANPATKHPSANRLAEVIRISFSALHHKLRVRRSGAPSARVHEWVRLVIEGSPALAARVATAIHDSGFEMYLTRELDQAKDYVKVRYEDEPEKRYGLIAPSATKKASC